MALSALQPRTLVHRRERQLNEIASRLHELGRVVSTSADDPKRVSPEEAYEKAIDKKKFRQFLSMQLAR